jgi:hypothetical protein
MIDVSFHPDADEELLEATEWYIKRSMTAAPAWVLAKSLSKFRGQEVTTIIP